MRYRVTFPHIREGKVQYQMASFADLKKASSWIFRRCDKIQDTAPVGKYHLQLIDSHTGWIIIKVQITVQEQQIAPQRIMSRDMAAVQV